MKKSLKKKLKIQFWKDFKKFLKEYNLVSVAIAFVIGGATRDLVQSFINNIFMPLLSPLISNGTWETAIFSFWSIEILWGAFLSNLLNFLLLGLIIFLIVKKLIKK